jgi:hypothetical protein
MAVQPGQLTARNSVPVVLERRSISTELLTRVMLVGSPARPFAGRRVGVFPTYERASILEAGRPALRVENDRNQET